MADHIPANAGWFERADASDLAGLARSIREGGIEDPRDWPSRATESGFAEDEDDYYARLHQATIHVTRQAVQQRERADDQQLKHAIRAMDDMGRNLL